MFVIMQTWFGPCDGGQVFCESAIPIAAAKTKEDAENFVRNFKPKLAAKQVVISDEIVVTGNDFTREIRTNFAFGDSTITIKEVDEVVTGG